MANGHRLWVERYTTLMIGVFCTLGSVVYFTQIQHQYPSVHNIVALETQVKENTAQTVAAVKQVKKQTSQAAGSAATAQAAAEQATKAADAAEAAARRHFRNEPEKMQIQDLYERSSNNRRSISLLTKRFDDCSCTPR